MKCSTLVQSQRWQNDLGLFLRQAIQHYSNSSLWPYHWCWRTLGWSVLWRLRRPPRTNTKKRCSIHHWGLGCKRRKSTGACSNRHVGPWRIKWSSARTNWILPKECTGHSKYPFATTRQMTLHIGITKQSIVKSNWLHSLQPKMEKLCTVSKNKTWTWL